jgi:predicted permease
MIVLDSLLPVFALILLGNRLKHHRLTDDTFLKTSDRLVYFIFFPAMLFWKIGGGGSTLAVDWRFCGAALLAVATTCLASICYAVVFKLPAFQVGTFCQSCYRFNTYIGMAIVLTALGEEGVQHFGVLVGLAIPPINVLAVSTLIWFSDQPYSGHQRAWITFRALVSNPLILGCLAGILYARLNLGFPAFLDNTLRLTSLLTLPLALLSIGGSLTLGQLRGNLSLCLVGAGFKLLLLPLAGFFLFRWLGVGRLAFHVGMIFCALPTSTAIYVLSSQLKSDTELASASIVVSTVLSFLSLSVALLLPTIF